MISWSGGAGMRSSPRWTGRTQDRKEPGITLSSPVLARRPISGQVIRRRMAAADSYPSGAIRLDHGQIQPWETADVTGSPWASAKRTIHFTLWTG